MVFPTGNTAITHPTRLGLPTTSKVIAPMSMVNTSKMNTVLTDERLAVMEAAGDYYNKLSTVPGKNLKDKAATWVEFTAQMSVRLAVSKGLTNNSKWHSSMKVELGKSSLRCSTS